MQGSRKNIEGSGNGAEHPTEKTKAHMVAKLENSKAERAYSMGAETYSSMEETFSQEGENDAGHLMEHELNTHIQTKKDVYLIFPDDEDGSQPQATFF